MSVPVAGKLVRRKLSIFRRSSLVVDSIGPAFDATPAFTVGWARDYFTRLATNSSVAKFATFRVNFISSPEIFPLYSMRPFWS